MKTYTFTEDQLQQVRDSLHLAGVVLRYVEDGTEPRSLATSRQSVGRACLLIDAVRNGTAVAS